MDLCTSRCYCTDGKTFTMDNETDQTFDSNEVDDQGIKFLRPKNIHFSHKHESF